MQNIQMYRQRPVKKEEAITDEGLEHTHFQNILIFKY